MTANGEHNEILAHAESSEALVAELREKPCETCANFVREKSYPRKVGTCVLIHGSGGDRHEKVPRIAPTGWTWLQVPPDFGCILHQPKEKANG